MAHASLTPGIRPVSLLALALVIACDGASDLDLLQSSASVATYYVATGGSDSSGDGSATRPYATIAGAVARVPDGSVILVRPGTYRGTVSLSRKFATGVTVRSEQPYRAVLRNYGKVITCYGCQGITLEGLDVAHSGSGSSALVVQLDGQGAGTTSRVTLRNNVLHDSYNNDILKINNGAHDIVVTGNVFYNQNTSDEHIDINSVDNVLVEDNVFFNDYVGSGRSIVTDASSFIVIKDSNGTDDLFLGARNVRVRRNVFLNYQGSSGTGFVLVGEDGHSYYEAYDILVENNLMLGNSTVSMRSPFGVKGCRDVVFRNNTISGDLPGNAFATRINREGSNQVIRNVRFFNNMWADQTGTMGDFSDTPPSDLASFTLARNLYWNNGGAVPSDGTDAINFTSDAERSLANPGLSRPQGIASPRWSSSTGTFADGSATITDARLRLVERFGRPGTGASVIDRADPLNAPSDDILGAWRGAKSDLGAVELAPEAAPVAFVPPPPANCILAGAGGQTTVNTTMPSQIGSFTVTATLIPGASNMDGGFGLSRGPISYWSGAAAIVMFDATGTIRVRDGSSYRALVSFPYQAGMIYRVRMAVDLAAHRYSVWAAGPDGVEVQLARDFAFRTEWAALGSLDSWVVRAEVASLQACDVAY